MFTPLISTPGMPELLVILAIVILVFGASKLPDLARGTGQALRIFKAETKGLKDDDKDKTDAANDKPIEGRVVDSPRVADRDTSRDTTAG